MAAHRRLVVAAMTNPYTPGASGVFDMPADEYHRDPVPGGSLSSTGARKLLEPAGPAKFKYALDHPGEHGSPAFDFGTAAHQVILNDPENRVAVLPFPDWRSAKARDAADEARAAGLTPVLRKQWETVSAMSDAIRRHPQASTLLNPNKGKPEQTLIWRDETADVWCRARIDWLPHRTPNSRLILTDYKTTTDASAEAFGKSAANYGYFVQEMFYSEGARAVGLDEDPRFLFVVQEKEAPYLVNVVELDDQAKALGRTFVRIALNTYRDCRASGEWPGYAGIDLATLPGWFLRQYDEDTEMVI
jgi:hypothetical protein